MNSSMVKPEKFGHLHLVYHFTVPLNILLSKSYHMFSLIALHLAGLFNYVFYICPDILHSK